MIGEIIGPIAFAGAMFFVFVVLPLWLLGTWLNRNDDFVPQNDTRPVSLNDED